MIVISMPLPTTRSDSGLPLRADPLPWELPGPCVSEQAPRWKPGTEPRTSGSPKVPLLIPEWVAWSESVPVDEAQAERELYGSLVALRCAAPAVDWLLGAGLRLVGGKFDPTDVGALNYRHLAEETLGLDRRRAWELVGLAEALEAHPTFTAPYLEGEITRSQITEIKTLLTQENAAWWREKLRASSCSETRKLAKAARADRGWDASDEEETVEVCVDASQQDWDYLRYEGCEAIELWSGKPVTLAAAVEYLSREWALSFDPWMPEIEEAPDGGLDLEALLAKGAYFVEEKKEEEAGGGAVAPDGDAPAPSPTPCFTSTGTGTAAAQVMRRATRKLDPREARSTEELVEILRDLQRLAQSLSWQKGRVLRRCRLLEVGFDPAEVLGVSPREAAYLRKLDGDLRWRPKMRDSYVAGRMGWTKLRHLVLLARPSTEGPWLERTSRWTLRRTERTAEAMLRLWEANPVVYSEKTRNGMPPSDELLEELGVLPSCARATEEAVLRAANIRTAGEEDSVSSELFLGAPRHRTYRLRLPVEVAADFQAVLLGIMNKEKTIDQGKCLRHLVDHGIHALKIEHEALGSKRQAVAKRDRHRCQYPGCPNRVGESDHMELASQGGSNRMWNRQFLCAIHHHAGKHQGKFSIYGTAPHDVYYVIGRPGHPQEVWKNDERLGRVPVESRIRCEADLRRWLRTR